MTKKTIRCYLCDKPIRETGRIRCRACEEQATGYPDPFIHPPPPDDTPYRPLRLFDLDD